MKLTWTTRLGILGAALTVAILAIGTCRDGGRRSAPPAQAREVALQTSNANAAIDAQSSLDATSIKARADDKTDTPP